MNYYFYVAKHLLFYIGRFLQTNFILAIPRTFVPDGTFGLFNVGITLITFKLETIWFIPINTPYWGPIGLSQFQPELFQGFFWACPQGFLCYCNGQTVGPQLGKQYVFSILSGHALRVFLIFYWGIYIGLILGKQGYVANLNDL